MRFDIETNCIAAIARGGKSAVRQQHGRRIAGQLLPSRARWEGSVLAAVGIDEQLASEAANQPHWFARGALVQYN